jgi:predicted nucleic acid-binding protein
MARHVVDAPTLLHLVGQATPVHGDHQLVAPNTLRSQAMTLHLQAVRGGRLTEQEALQQHDRLTELKIRLLGDRVSRRTAWRIAREQGWESLEDAEYVAVARLQADALVTVDPAMAARCRGLVPLVPFDALFRGDAG